jgi:hypothetical protein
MALPEVERIRSTMCYTGMTLWWIFTYLFSLLFLELAWQCINQTLSFSIASL